jgi:hypothetical protein
MNESSESPNPPADPPKPSKGFTGKLPKKGCLSRKKGARPKQEELPQEDAGDINLPLPEVDVDGGGEPTPPVVASSNSSIRSQIELRGVKRKILSVEYESELKRVYAELDASQASLALKDLENSALKKRNKTKLF